MRKLFLFLALSLASLSAAYSQNVLESIAIDSGGRLSASLLVLETGQSLWILPDAPCPMRGVYRLPIVMAALAKVDQNKLKLEQKIVINKEDFISEIQSSLLRNEHPDGNLKISVKELLHHAITNDDGTASDVLLRLLGGPPVVMQYLAQLGIQDIKVLDTEKEMGKSRDRQYRNTATPKAMIKLLQALQETRALSPQSRDLLLKWMSDAETTPNSASSPNPARIKALLPASTPVAHKIGSSTNRNSMTAAHNDVGIITLPNGHHMAVAVFLTDSKAPHTSRDLTIAKITKVGWDAWAKK
ncbi:class A beta-lactamase [Undibacterium umbellatum]|uniref:beta-lactamase n=1 Tax=Undibacterium umbellatum TaxID=2762300 RepID=A0ABR6Z2R2_9BURK|nr:class A beta-lactamase [Undibacterium umbellatum]MBC3906045.1 class A beta-lactamase [Undibacterium umbellatum]